MAHSRHRAGVSTAIGDYDNDGWQDIYFGCSPDDGAAYNRIEGLDILARNDGTTHFSNVISGSGITEPSYPRNGNSAVFYDNNRDGDLDLSVDGYTFDPGDNSFYTWVGLTNDPTDPAVPLRRAFLEVAAEGAMRPSGTRRLTNRDGQGARVTVIYNYEPPGGAIPTEAQCLAPTPPGVTAITREVFGGNHGQNPELHFGLGGLRPSDQNRVDCVIARFPSGVTVVKTGVVADSRIVISEGASGIKVVAVDPFSGPTAGNTPVSIVGFNFEPGCRTYFNGILASNMLWLSANLLTCNTPTNQPAGAVDVKVVNPDNTEDTLAAGYRYVASSGDIDVRDPNSELLSGSDVSSDYELLGSGKGRAVTGIAADGVTRVLLQLQVAGPGNVTFSIKDELNDTTTVGGLRPVGGTGGQPSIVVPAHPMNDGRYIAFAILQAPLNFIRTPGDGNLASRPLYVRAMVGATPHDRTLSVVRTAVLLLHGVWSSDATWNWPSLVNDPLHRWVVYPGNYGGPDGTADRLFSTNVMTPYFLTREALRLQRLQGIAATQATVVGHSMGGLLTRIDASGMHPWNARPNNYGTRDYYQLITLDTPHIGAATADLLVSLRDSPITGPLAIKWFAKGQMCITCGAVDDLRTTSIPIRTLPAANLPAHALVSVGGSDLIQRGADRVASADPNGARILSILDDLGVSPETVLFNEPHDLIVGQASQYGGLTGTPTTLFHYVNVQNEAIHTSVTSDEDPSGRVIDLLNLPITAPEFASGFLAAPPILADNTAQPIPSTSRSAPVVTDSAPPQPASTEVDSIILSVAKNANGRDSMLTWNGAPATARVMKSLNAAFTGAFYCTMIAGTAFTDAGALAGSQAYFYAVDGVQDPSCSTNNTTTRVSGVNPAAGSTTGDATYIIGQNFQTGATVTFGGISAYAVTVLDPNTIKCRAPAHAVGTVDVTVRNSPTDAATKSGAYQYVDTTGALIITEPLPNVPVRQGQQVRVTVAVSGFTPVRMGFNAPMSVPPVLRASPWATTLTVDQSAVGPYEIDVAAFDAEGNVREASVTVNAIVSGATLQHIVASPSPVILFPFHLTGALRVTGRYSDGVDRDVTSPESGTTYRSEDSNIASVDPKGRVTGQGAGKTHIVVENGGVMASVLVDMDRLPMVLTFGSKTSVSWPIDPEATGFDLVQGDLMLLRSTHGLTNTVLACILDKQLVNSTALSQTPSAGQGFYYVLRSRLPSIQPYDELPDWPGGVQSGSRDAGIAASANRCP